MSHAKAFIIFSLILSLVICSCQSNNRTEIDRIAAEHSIQIDRITRAVADYGEYIDATLTNLEHQGKQLSGNINELAHLMEQYFVATRELLHRYRELQRVVEQTEFYDTQAENLDNSTSSIDYPMDIMQNTKGGTSIDRT